MAYGWVESEGVPPIQKVPWGRHARAKEPTGCPNVAGAAMGTGTWSRRALRWVRMCQVMFPVKHHLAPPSEAAGSRAVPERTDGRAEDAAVRPIEV